MACDAAGKTFADVDLVAFLESGNNTIPDCLFGIPVEHNELLRVEALWGRKVFRSPEVEVDDQELVQVKPLHEFIRDVELLRPFFA